MNAKYHGIKSLSELYAKKHETTLKVAEQRVKEMILLLEEGLVDEDYNGIQFIDSFTLKKVVRKSKIGRNPMTRVEVVIPDRIGVKTELSKSLQNRIEQRQGV